MAIQDCNIYKYLYLSEKGYAQLYMYNLVYKKLDNNNNVSNRQKTLPNYFISMNKENQKK